MTKEIAYQWNNECQEAFDYLKNWLTMALILVHSNFNKEFLIQTDALALRLGIVLSQKDNNGWEVVIQYAS